MKRLIIAGSICAALLLGYYAAFLNYLEPYEIGIAWNWAAGESYVQDRSGWHVTAPWIMVARIDTRRTRVCITSTAHASFNCKLVEFVPSAYKEFLALEGFRYYWWSNRFSINSGYGEEYRGFRDVLRGYAFGADAKKYRFIKIDEEYQPSP